MTLKKIKGDLLDMAENGDFDYIIHGCNCFNAMGAGIARQIADRYPNAQEVDNLTEKGEVMKLGNFTCAGTGKFIVVNAYTQYHTSRAGEDVFEYEAFALILKKVLHTFGGHRYGLPYIGMGLAGGDKTVILSIIENWAKEVSAKGGSVTLVEWV